MKRSDLKILLVSVTFLLIDQLSKYLVVKRGRFFILNPDRITFGFLEVGSLGVWLLLAFSLAAFLWFRSRLKRGLLGRIFLGLFLGGVVSNSFDRVFRHGVVDWINLKVWPFFNLADVGIVAGLFFISYYIFIHQDKTLGANK